MHKINEIDEELSTLLIHYTEEELKQRFLKNFGCINFRDEKFFHELSLARAFHAHHKKLWPALHDEHEIEPFRCYHQTICKCGFSEAYDSSD